MAQWMRVILLCWLTSLAILAFAGPPPGAFSDDLGTALYDCQLTLKSAPTLSLTSTVSLALEWSDAKNYTRVVLARDAITIDSVHAGNTTRITSIPSGVIAGKNHYLTVFRRNDKLGIYDGQNLLFLGAVPRLAGLSAGVTAGAGWTVVESRIQRLEPVVFADDFMRGEKEIGPWTRQYGKWTLQSAWDRIPHGNNNRYQNSVYAQNPFAWIGNDPYGGAALCTVGEPFWEDYTVTAAVCPSENGAVGIQVNMPNGMDGVRVRWSPGNDRGERGNRLMLYHIRQGKATLLASDEGGYIPGQWYKLSVSANFEGVRVAIDGRERLKTDKPGFLRGAVGLYTEGKNGAIFDDVTIYGHSLQADILLENRQSRIKQRFHDDPNGMQKWSTSRNDWQVFPDAPGFRMHQWDIYGDQWMTLTVKPTKLPTGELTMILQGDGKSPQSGYRAIFKAGTTTGTMRCLLYRDDTLLVEEPTVDLPIGKEHQIYFWHIGQRLWAEVDGEMVAEALDATPLTTMRPAYAADGCFALAHDASVMGKNIFDYSFAEAPVDWIQVGTWMPSIRWSCSPNWSFLAGWSRGDAILWHKQRFSGDQSLQAFMGLKMEYPGQREVEQRRLRDLCITICGNGSDPRTGYTGVFAASEPEVGKNENRRITLMRNGVVVASAPGPRFEEYEAHQRWFQLELRKHGNTVQFYVDNKPTLRYVDPEPISEGVPAVWTTDNGICLARVRMHSSSTPTPRADVPVVLDNPLCPEWADLGSPLTISFANTWSMRGEKVQLMVTPRSVPEGEDGQITVEDLRMTIVPKRTGDHWYQVQAVDEDGNRSPAYNISLPVYNPGLKRDDSRAIVLYRFTEGTGNVVLDKSTVAPAANITIPKGANTRWIPNQGLFVHGTTPLTTAHGVNKLMALAKQKAFTIELWVSTSTIAPPTETSGSMLSWELGQNKQNFAVGQTWYDFCFAANGVGQYRGGEGEGFMASDTARPWLQHFVITSDGKSVRIYANGEKKRDGACQSLNLTKWNPSAVLVLGNNSYGGASYIGTYYLVAIHDRCLTDADVLRHFKAGPSA